MAGAYRGYSERNVAGPGFRDAYAFGTAQRKGNEAEAADAALRRSLATLGPDATQQQLIEAATPALASSPGQGSALMTLQAGGVQSRAAAAAAEQARQFEAAQAAQARQNELADTQSERAFETGQTAAEHKMRLSEIGARSAGANARSAAADARAAEDRKNRAEIEVAKLIGSGEVDAARLLAGQNDIALDDEVWMEAAGNGEFQQVMALIGEAGTQEYGDALLKAFQETGSFNDAVLKAGAPPKKPTSTAGASSADERIAQRLMDEEGISFSDALRQARAAKANPKIEAAKLAEKAVEGVFGEEKEQARKDAYAYYINLFTGDGGAEDGGGDAEIEDDPLGLFTDG